MNRWLPATFEGPALIVKHEVGPLTFVILAIGHTRTFPLGTGGNIC